jgi:hypothetical protein
VEVRGALGDGLNDVVRTGLAELRVVLDAVDRALPDHVERELERFLVCGDPSQGCAWPVCEGCDVHRLVPFSCKDERSARRAGAGDAGAGSAPSGPRAGGLKVALCELRRRLRTTSGLRKARAGLVPRTPSSGPAA